MPTAGTPDAITFDSSTKPNALVRAEVPEPADVAGWDAAALGAYRRSQQFRIRRASPPRVGRLPDVAPPDVPFDPPAVAKGPSLSELLQRRRSRRAFAPSSLPFSTLADLLWLSARDRADDSSRPYPSAGGIYSLEIYLAASGDGVAWLKGGVYRYRPDAHGLDKVHNAASDATPFLKAAGRAASAAAAPAVLLISSRMSEVAMPYRELAYSLVLKEVGGLFQTLYLVAEWLGLAGCALGGGAPSAKLAGLCGVTELDQPLVGEFLVGPRLSELRRPQEASAQAPRS